MSLRIGDIAPNFKVETTEGTIDFHEWIGSDWCFFFSHPADFTPVCTTEMGRTAQLSSEFEKRNTKPLGLSTDSVEEGEGEGEGECHPFFVDNPSAVPEGYATLIEIDHASLVANENFQSDGSDLSFEFGGEARAFVLDQGSDFNRSFTRLWLTLPSLDAGNTEGCLLRAQAPESPPLDSLFDFSYPSNAFLGGCEAATREGAVLFDENGTIRATVLQPASGSSIHCQRTPAIEERTYIEATMDFKLNRRDGQVVLMDVWDERGFGNGAGGQYPHALHR